MRSSDRSMIGERCQVQRHTNTAPSTTATRERGDDPRAAPAPLLSLDDPQHQRGDREREQQRAEQVGHAPATGRAALDQLPAGQHDRDDPDRQVDQEDQPPVGGGDEQAAQRRPRPAAAAATADSSATPWERRSGGKALSTRASEAGTRKAAPSACTTRKATSGPSDGATAHSSEAAVNSSRPKTNMRRRPSRSAIRPAATRKAANTML